ncbi:MAG: thioredoxin [Candidatus Delongbacteria bacterium]|nr:thioredoxin [Candidatus Delongbacteria bacterium]
MYKQTTLILLFGLILPLIAANKNLTILSDDNFKKEVLESEQIVLVDFWAPWCGPCKKLGPIIEELANENNNIKFTKLNVDNSKKVAGSYGIRSIPTVAIFKDGKPIDGFVGLKSKSEIETILKKYSQKAETKSTEKSMPKKNN